MTHPAEMTSAGREANMVTRGNGDHGPGAEIAVLIVDDHSVVREGVKAILALEGDVVVRWEAEGAREALRLLRRERPDVVVADLSLNDASGIELVKEMHGRWPNLPILVLSMHDEKLYAERLLRAGARGYLMKDRPPSEIAVAIRRILRGEPYVSPEVASRLFRRSFDGGDRSPVRGLGTLTDREFEVLDFIGAGRKTREIAQALHLSAKTIETHRRRLRKKLGLEDAVALQRYALARSLDSARSESREPPPDPRSSSDRLAPEKA